MMRNEVLKYACYARPQAVATIQGNSENSKLFGKAKFFNSPSGCVVQVEVFNLPQTQTNFFAMHIHENGECEGDFSSAGNHFGTGPHPTHAGDLPPLLSSNGFAFSLFLDNRFCVADIIGKSIIIHENPDDFTSQPSGNSGARIACGIIVKNR